MTQQAVPGFDPDRKYVSAGALYFRNGHLLLVNPVYKAHWEIPGGLVEAGESPHAACQREVQEELGRALPLGRLLGIDYRVTSRFGEGLHFIFDGGELAPNAVERFSLPPEELSEYRLVEPGRLAELLPPALTRRVQRCIAARASGVTVYMEAGEPIG